MCLCGWGDSQSVLRGVLTGRQPVQGQCNYNGEAATMIRSDNINALSYHTPPLHLVTRTNNNTYII